MSKLIPLTQGKFAIVDDEDFEYLNQHKWHACKRPTTWYAIRNIHKPDGKQTMIRMHREILKPPSGLETDHKDGNGLNNRRYNLRVATCSQNQQNRRKIRGRTSRFKGVYLRRYNAKWGVAITVKRKTLHLGTFVSETQAAQAYDQAARTHFGEFAHVNFYQE
mgnify:CR=1 FL=1